jgi:predicted Zn-dependent protease with MMP-like domain
MAAVGSASGMAIGVTREVGSRSQPWARDQTLAARQAHRRALILATPVVVAGLAALMWSLTGAGAGAGAAQAAQPAQRFPVRNTSGRTDCSAEPGRPLQVGSGYGSLRAGGGGFPVVGSIDANGCDSWVYQHAGSFGPDTSFFAGPGFAAGQHAYQDSTQETTELVDGHQLIRVVDPSSRWLRIYKGYDVCTTGSGSTKTCIAPAPEREPDSWAIYIPIGIVLALMALFLVHFLRPAGPVRRPRHYRRVQHNLAHAMPVDPAEQLQNVDVRQLQKRLRRLEETLSSQAELSESQRHWFSELVASGRHGMALESLARWMAESHVPVGDHLRDEALWLADSLDIERQVRPVLDAQVFAHEDDFGPHLGPSTGFDVPLDEFQQLVSDAVDSLPPAFGKAMTNVAVVVEEEHNDADRLGQYQGHPLAAPRYRTWLLHPDKITIYRKTICEHCQSRDEVKALVYRVVIHEIAHHFGIDDPRLRELGW